MSIDKTKQIMKIGELNLYTVKVDRGNKSFTIKTTATSEDKAKEIVSKAELCPVSILTIVRTKKIADL